MFSCSFWFTFGSLFGLILLLWPLLLVASEGPDQRVLLLLSLLCWSSKSSSEQKEKSECDVQFHFEGSRQNWMSDGCTIGLLFEILVRPFAFCWTIFLTLSLSHFLSFSLSLSHTLSFSLSLFLSFSLSLFLFFSFSLFFFFSFLLFFLILGKETSLPRMELSYMIAPRKSAWIILQIYQECTNLEELV